METVYWNELGQSSTDLERKLDCPVLDCCTKHVRWNVSRRIVTTIIFNRVRVDFLNTYIFYLTSTPCAPSPMLSFINSDIVYSAN